LVMGPWFHGGWSFGDGDRLGNVPFNSKTSEYYREHIELPFFNYWLKGKGTGKEPKAYVFETGSNVWRELDSWPPKNAREQTLYLQAAGKLAWSAPAGAPAFDEYVSDPARPVPYTGTTSLSMTREHMDDDQRFAAARTDVLVYQTEPLTEDLTIAGPIANELFVSTTGTDSDFVVKVVDVYPDTYPDASPNPSGVRMGGYEQLVRGELFRGRYRKGYDHPEAFQPGEVARIHYTMPDVFHTFRAGHRIMIQVQSSWFPLADRNPQKFVDIYHAKPEDFQKATEHVYRGGSQASEIKVLVVK
jgi:putative CocE/NonD family hydrolase